MTVNAIIEQLYRLKELDDCIKKMVRDDLQADFKQELFINILTIPEEKLKGMHLRKELKFYTVRILLNLVRGKNSRFNKAYVQPDRSAMPLIDGSDSKSDEAGRPMRIVERWDDVQEQDEFINRQHREDLEMRMVDEIDNGLDGEFNTPYYRHLVHLVDKWGSQREVARQTGIPVSTISEAIKKVRNHLTNKCYNDPAVLKGPY